jgi:hypothetical protein
MPNHLPIHQATNTSNWVDELYSKKLASKAIRYVVRAEGEESPIFRLDDLKQSRIYLRNEIVRGPGLKRLVRAYLVDLAIDGEGRSLTILHCDYDPRNGRIRKNTAKAAVHVALPPHALERLFERLRTNALGDVYRIALRPLSRVPSPEPEQYEREDLVIHLVGFGTFPVKVILAQALTTGEGGAMLGRSDISRP